jgi:hypothetical protein
MKTKTSFQYLESENPELLRQYFELRRRSYLLEYPWLPPTFGAPEYTDRVSRIVLAVRAGMVAGGARLTLSTPQTPRQLPLEEAGFRLRESFQLAHLRLDSTPYGEISRMAVEPGVSEGMELSFGITRACCDIAASQGADVLFGICPERPARLNRRNAKRLALPFDTYGQLGTVFGKEMTLCAFIGLTHRCIGPEKDAA